MCGYKIFNGDDTNKDAALSCYLVLMPTKQNQVLQIESLSIASKYSLRNLELIPRVD